MKRFLYSYFGYLGAHNLDIPGHSFYQPFLIEEICKRLSKNDEYEVEIYPILPLKESEENTSFQKLFSCYLPGVKDYLVDWANKHISIDSIEFKENELYGKLGDIIYGIRNDYYDCLILKARFRNLSTHNKKLYDVLKFEKICEEAIKKMTPVLIVDTDLSLSNEFIENYINRYNNFKIISLGDLSEAYPCLDKNKIYSTKRLHGIDTSALRSIRDSFDLNPEQFVEKSRKFLLYYGNIAFSNYKVGQTKNREVLEYIIKLGEEEFFKYLQGYIIGKVEDIAFLRHFENVKREKRDTIAELHRSARISINISKELYNRTNFTPARVTESWIFGVIPLSYSVDVDYLGNKEINFQNYREFVENIRLITDCSVKDYTKMFMKFLNNYIDHIEYRVRKLS